ncbi:MAG TPA: hypothetical protein VIJ50_06445 [Solirubrobacteraceae bacterium]
MLARRRRHRLSNGVEIQTPVIIPSLSTRNVGRIDVDDVPESISSAALRIVGGQLDEAMLVSAYDLARRPMFEADRLLAGATNTVYDSATLLMIDSGLYETRERVGYDDGAAATVTDWDEAAYEVVLQTLPDVPIAIVNFDVDHAPFSDQIAAAQRLFAAHSSRASVMLLKPEHEKRFIDDALLGAVAADLRSFDIVAVTEKELGNTLLERLRTLVRVRRVLERSNVAAPLHVFGGLDPLLTPLYIACGAEIVDGVGWLRYAYLDDAAHHLETRAVRDLDSRVDVRLLTTVNRNLLYMRDLKRRLEILIDNGDWLAYSPAQGRMLEDLWRRVASTEDVT